MDNQNEVVVTRCNVGFSVLVSKTLLKINKLVGFNFIYILKCYSFLDITLSLECGLIYLYRRFKLSFYHFSFKI